MAIVDEASTLVLKSTSITDDAGGYEKLQAHREAQPITKPNVAQGRFGDKAEVR